MNNSTSNLDELLDEVNTEKAKQMIPVMAYLGILMITGVFGNIAVLYYFGCKAKTSSSTVFILALSIYDILICLMSVPIEISDMLLYYTFTNSGACKFMRFVNHFAAVGSILVLLVISVDRYRKLCLPFKKQIGIKQAHIASGVSIIVAILFAWPVFLLYTSETVDVKSKTGIPLKGHDCTTRRDVRYKVYLWIFNGIYLISFIVSTVLLSTMYGLVWRAVIKHVKMKKLHSFRGSHSVTKGTRFQLTDLNSLHTGLQSGSEHSQSANSPSRIRRSPTARDHATGIKSDSEHFQSANSPSRIRRSPTARDHAKDHLDKETIRYTTMMLAITIVFILSYVPYLALLIWRAVLGKYESEYLSNSELVAFNVGIRSYFLNSAVNPFLYAAFNPKFRSMVCSHVCFCIYGKFNEHNVSSNSGTKTTHT